MKPAETLPKEQLQLGEISGLHGVQGWVKVFSDTQPRENIFSYSPWSLSRLGKAQQVEVLHWRKQGKTLVAKLKGLDDREQARALIGAKISVDKAVLPSLQNNEYYWHQLIGLTVISCHSGQDEILGVVAEMMETGSNDVMLVRSDAKEHLVPWVFGDYVLGVDLEAGQVTVDWDPEF